MNRRGFISLLGGAAGAALIPWRMDKNPFISLPGITPNWYTLNAMDMGRVLYLDSAALDGVIIPNSFPIGSIFTIANKGTRPLRLAGSLILAGEKVECSPALAGHGICSPLAIQRDQWILSGTGLS